MDKRPSIGVAIGQDFMRVAGGFSVSHAKTESSYPSSIPGMVFVDIEEKRILAQFYMTYNGHSERLHLSDAIQNDLSAPQETLHVLRWSQCWGS